MARNPRPDLTGKVIVVTGANAGIGKETAAAIATMGATVVMTARSRSKGEDALAEVLRSPESGAKTTVLLASSERPRIAGSTGGYFSHGWPWRPSHRARSTEEAAWLWAESERLVASGS